MNTFLLRSASERMHRNDAAKQRYYAAIRPWDFILPISINHLPFKDMHIDISGYLRGLGWETTIVNLPTEFSPLATKLFYSNMRSSKIYPNTYTTIIMDDHIRFSVQVLSCLLDIPIIGQVINEEADMWRIGFDGLSAFLELCPGFPLGFLPSKLLARFLPSPLRLLHYFITRIILPRSFCLDELLPVDVFILWHASNLKPLSLPHLLMIHLYSAAKDGYPGDLPCAPLITRFLFNMGIDFYGLEMTYPEFITTPADVFTAIDLSPPNSPDVSSGGEEESVADNNVNPTVNPETSPTDVNPAANANLEANHADVSSADYNHVNATVNFGTANNLNLVSAESDYDDDPGSPISSGVPNNAPKTLPLMMGCLSAVVTVKQGVLVPHLNQRRCWLVHPSQLKSKSHL
ncbi:hypothetical protein LINGRAHAP2_LOCUS30486 [Linum grandiflorum]